MYILPFFTGLIKKSSKGVSLPLHFPLFSRIFFWHLPTLLYKSIFIVYFYKNYFDLSGGRSSFSLACDSPWQISPPDPNFICNL
jgi:hypothetical protein